MTRIPEEWYPFIMRKMNDILCSKTSIPVSLGEMVIYCVI
jgi:hypothetical protein